MTVPLVSVVIPCYRQGHFLPAAVASVFAQSHPAVEPVVVNDGSDDDTHDVATRYGSRIVYVRQENKELPAARNAGIRASRGKYLLFLDADDLLHPDAIAWLLGAAGGAEDRLGVLGYAEFTTDPADPTNVSVLPTVPALLPYLIHANLGPPHTYLTSRAAVDAVGGFEPALRSCADWDLWLRLAAAGVSYRPVNRIGAYYRRTPGSMSSDPVRMLTYRAEVLLRAIDLFTRSGPLLAAWGENLVVAARRVRRRCWAQVARPDLVERLTAALRGLAARGFRPAAGGKEAVLSRVIGPDRAELLLLGYYRRFDRAVYRHYQEGYT
ncbi:MAG: hypothetical protein JWO38_5576 [Gemmataceae bacterium]|nr:hypothetical protein [Gemmataceae bacterium]